MFDFLLGRGLTPIDKAVWFTIRMGCQLCDGFMSLPEIAHYVKCSRSTVAESITRLEAAGVLIANRESGKRTQYRTVNWSAIKHANI